MPILLMRHGETEWNITGRKQGRGNSALTERGRKQAYECGEAIKSLSIDLQKIFVSPLGRAQDTCNIVSSVLSFDAENIITVDALAELDYGEWQGLTDQEIDHNFPGERVNRKSSHWCYKIPGGESYSMVHDRIIKCWSDIEISNSLIIAHEMVNRVILGTYQGFEHKDTLAISHPHGRIYLLNDGSVECMSCARGLSD